MDAMKAPRFRRLDGDGDVMIEPTYERPVQPGVQDGYWQVRYPGEAWQTYVFAAQEEAPAEIEEIEFDVADRVCVVECPSHPKRVGRTGLVTLRRTLVNGYDYSVLLDGDDNSTGQYRPEWLEPEGRSEPGYFIGGEFVAAETVHSAADVLDSLTDKEGSYYRGGGLLVPINDFDRRALAVASAVLKERIVDAGGPHPRVKYVQAARDIDALGDLVDDLARRSIPMALRAIRDAYFDALAAEYLDAMPVGKVREMFGWQGMTDLPDPRSAKADLIREVEYLIGERVAF